MSAKELLQGFKSTVEMQSQIQESDVSVTAILGNEKNCSTTIAQPVEGQVKLYEVSVKEIGTFNQAEMN